MTGPRRRSGAGAGSLEGSSEPTDDGSAVPTQQEPAVRLTTREEFETSPEAVFAVIRTEDFQQAKCRATSAGKFTVDLTEDGDRTVIRSQRHLPSDGLPEAARSFVGEELTVVETQDWGPADPDGTRVCRVDLHVTGAPLTFRGEAVLAPGGRGTLETLEGDLKANVPFIGGRIEKAAADPILAAITLEAETLREFLAR